MIKGLNSNYNLNDVIMVLGSNDTMQKDDDDYDKDTCTCSVERGCSCHIAHAGTKRRLLCQPLVSKLRKPELASSEDKQAKTVAVSYRDHELIKIMK